MTSVHRIVVVALLASAALFELVTSNVHERRLLQLEHAYSVLQNESCSKILPKVPEFGGLDYYFMLAYQNFTGNVSLEGPVLDLASELLSLPNVVTFLSLPDSFVKGGLDYYMVQCAVLSESTPKGLAEFAVQGTAEEALVDRLLDDTILMRDMLLAGGAKGGKYPEAVIVYDKLLNASEVIGDEALTQTPWDDRNQSTILHRLILGMAVEHAVPMTYKYPDKDGNHNVIDYVQRYLHYERAYLAGDLDPAFEVLTAFECRWVGDGVAYNQDYEQFRKTLGIYRPEHIVTGNYGWRYARAVKTDVHYGPEIFPDARAEYPDLPAAGGECGPRAFYGRFCKRAFGLPVWGVKQPGHAAMSTWTPTGWVVLLGSSFAYSYWGNQGGCDFQLETQSREHRMDYQKVLRGQWVSLAKGEKPYNRGWTPNNPQTYGKGGLWSALMLYAKKLAIVNGTVPRPIGKSVVYTKVEAFIKRWNVKVPHANITIGPDGTMTIPAVAFTAKNRSAKISIQKSMSDEGYHIRHEGGDEIDVERTSFEYEITVDEAGTRFLTANISSWHMNQDLHLDTNVGLNKTVPVYYTVGYWNQTQSMKVNLVKGKNLLRFVRRSEDALAIKEFFLYKTKPDIPPPPKNHTPGPPPPPLAKYIELSAGKTCESQGIEPLTPKECTIACEYFGFKDTGSRNREFFSGCFVLVAGEWKGNGNFNTNTSAVCCDPDARALCLRR